MLYIYIRQMELEIQGIISQHSIYGQKQYARSNSINFKRKAGGLFVYQVIETAGLIPIISFTSGF